MAAFAAPPPSSASTKETTTMTNLYKIDLKVCATAYIKAASTGDAMEKVRHLTRRSIVTNGGDGDVLISDLEYDHPGLPEISVSPAMTIHGVWSDVEEKEATMELAHLGAST
jgi:hypothetical protein